MDQWAKVQVELATLTYPVIGSIRATSGDGEPGFEQYLPRSLESLRMEVRSRKPISNSLRWQTLQSTILTGLLVWAPRALATLSRNPRYSTPKARSL